MPFWTLGLVLVLAAVGIGILSWWQLRQPPPWWAALIPAGGAALALGSAWRMTRHAYLLLSPVGVEIFPLWNPVRNFQLVPWSDIAGAEFTADGKWLILTLAGYEDSKIFLTLEPIRPEPRELLKKAVLGVLEKRDASSGRS